MVISYSIKVAGLNIGAEAESFRLHIIDMPENIATIGETE